MWLVSILALLSVERTTSQKVIPHKSSFFIFTTTPTPICIKPAKFSKLSLMHVMVLQDFPTDSFFRPSGTYCNSASACFVASDGKNLRLYQAVVDARKLLDELSDPETSVS